MYGSTIGPSPRRCKEFHDAPGAQGSDVPELTRTRWTDPSVPRPLPGGRLRRSPRDVPAPSRAGLATTRIEPVASPRD